jgi:parallel beta-helix repeat protein
MSSVAQSLWYERGNEASNGAGIFNIGTVTLGDDTVISHNRANTGGGIFHGQPATADAMLSLGNATISNNVAESSGGGIHLVDDSTVSAGPRVSITGNVANTSNGGGGIFRAA